MASGDFEDRTNAFLTWFKSLPGATFSDSIKIVDLRERNAGRGIVATEDIAADTTLFTIPRKAIINVLTSDLPKGIPSVFDSENGRVDGHDDEPRQNSWSHLILVMVYEFLRGEQSPWKPYFDVLPQAFDTPMFWSQNELSELQASPLLGKVGKEEAEGMFRANILPVIRQNPELFTSSAEATDEELIELAHRMGSTIMAYAFDLENEDEQNDGDDEEWVEDREGESMLGMVPMADILNADAEFNAHVNHGDDALTVTALRTIRAGEEILNYYGPLPNSELLRRYGYVTPRHSRYDVVELPWEIVEACLTSELAVSAETLGRIRTGIEESDVLEDSFVLERETSEPNPDGTFAAASPAFTGPDESLVAQLKGFCKAIKKINPDLIPDKRKRDSVIEAVLAKSLHALEARYPTDVAEDERLLREGGLGQRRRMAIEVRMGEKKLLQEAKNFLRGQQDGESEASKRARTS